MGDKVSIIIPTYNGEKYIAETIDSCLRQTYKNIEILVIDDCSSDKTVEILELYKEKIKTTINEKNQGLVKNINKMALKSNNKYLLFLGHDDVLPDNHIELMLSEFDDDTVAVHCNSIIINDKGNELRITKNDDLQIKKTSNCLFEMSIENFISSTGMIHKAEIFRKVNGWVENYKNCGEWLFYIRELKYGKIRYSKKTKAYYRKHQTNMTNSFNKVELKKGLNEYWKNCRQLAHISNQNTIIEDIKFYSHEVKWYLNNLFINKLKSYLKSLR